MKLGKLWPRLALGAALVVAYPSPGESAKKYKEIEVADGGSVSGKVSFEGTLPEDAIENSGRAPALKMS